jgi:NADH-quinone oxidoreductase subunit L
MFMALGAGVGSVAQLAVVAAMFHLFTHAFFKALLFLASGSVMHAMGNVIDMRRFGGLRHRLPYTCWTFAIGGLALSAIPPLSGFFSKDEILLALSSASHHGGWIYIVIYWIAIFTAFLTAFYTGRAFFMTFFGPEKLPSPDDPLGQEPSAGSIVSGANGGHRDEHAPSAGEHTAHLGHESPAIMIYPLFALAGCTALIGLVCLIAGPVVGPAGWFAHHLHATFRFESLGHVEHGFDWFTSVVGTIAALAGLGLSYRMYAEPSPIPARLVERFKPLYEASKQKFLIDEFYERVIVGPTRGLAIVCEFLDDYLVDRLVVGVAKLPRAVGRDVLARYQNGLIQFYATVSALSIAALLLILVLFNF